MTAPVTPPEAVEAVGTAWLAHGTCAPTDPARPRSRRCACGEVLPSRSEWAWHRDRAIAAAVVAALGNPDQDALARAWAEGKTAGLEQAADHVRTGRPNIRVNPYGGRA